MIIHQVLDKLHMHYSGLLNPELRGTIPSNDDVQNYFDEVEDSLRARGIRAINQDLRDTAISALKEFNRREGSSLYPNIIDSECNLQANNPNFVLHGVVDVLRNSSQDIDTEVYDPVEIWDYKGSKFPNPRVRSDVKKLADYTFQMLVYGELYRMKKGKYPSKGVLYFINELNNPQSVRNNNHMYIIDFTDSRTLQRIDEAMEVFTQTVRNIEICKANDMWDAPTQANRPGDETCDICDLRWSCPAVRNIYRMRQISSR
jgi:putative RecB family exonuclease